MRADSNRLLGSAGLVLVTAGVILYGILYTSGWVALIPMLIGLVMTIVSLASGYRSATSEGSRRSARYSLSAGLSVIVMAAILVFLQTLSYRHNRSFDLTHNRRFSLAPQTDKLLAGLPTDVTITAFYKEASQERILLQDLLSAFRARSPRVAYLLIDPDRDPVAARRYGVTRTGIVFIESGDASERLEQPSEERLVNAIARVAGGSSPQICFLTGHGEKSISETGSHGYSALREALQLENYEARELLAVGADSIPADCDIIVIAGPQQDILQRERNMLFDYLITGGRALFLLDPMTEIPNIEMILAGYGIRIGKDIVVDRYGKLLAGNYLTPVVNRYGAHPITEGFRQFTFFPQARSILVARQTPEGLSTTALCSTNEEAYAETDLAALLEGHTSFDPEEDRKGPLNLAAAAELELGTVVAPDAATPAEDFPHAALLRSRIVVFGDSDFAVNTNLRLSGNRDLIMNTLSWLVEADDLIAIRPVDMFYQPVLISARQGRAVFWISVVAMPALVVAIGFATVARKRFVD